MSIFLVVVQFVVVYVRVMPYLHTTFGPDSTHYVVFKYLGFPFGLLLLDGLMFAEPFGLLAILPFPAWIKQFLPAYKATRIIAEVAIEAFCMSVLQSFIYVVVLAHVRAGTASAPELAMVEFASVLPTSILISTINMLKVWIEVVNGAQAAGLTVGAKAMQLWEVGAGLPLDAIKKGTIVEWSCPYLLDGPEVPPLLDALGRNSSLVHLDLTVSGLTWSGPGATGEPLLVQMSSYTSTLSGLRTLVISEESRCRIPVSALRQGGDVAVAALRATPFFGGDGCPRREELLWVGELLRVVSVSRLEEDAARERAVSMRAVARNGKLPREMWEQQTSQLLVDGRLRRGHLMAIISAEALRDVGFTASQLLASGFALSELHSGGFDAAGLRAAGLKAAELSSAGFSAGELRIGGFNARDLRAVGFSPIKLKEGGFVAKQLREIGLSAEELLDNQFSASQMREGGYPLSDLKRIFVAADLREADIATKEMREAGYTLKELKEGDYSAEDLRGAGYYCSEMKQVGFTINQLKHAGYAGAELRIAGFTATEVKVDGAFTCKKVKGAGYTASEAIEADWTVEVLKAAGYEAIELREAKRSAKELTAAGYTLSALRGAGYGTQELQDTGYGAEELRSAGVSLSELAMAGATVAQLKMAGISVVGLKAEGMPLEELKAVRPPTPAHTPFFTPRAAHLIPKACTP